MNIYQLRRVRRQFQLEGQSLEILRDINLEVGAADTVAILGQSGSGKSTLLSLLAGLDLPSGGQILFENRAFAEMSENEISKIRGNKIGIVFQQFYLMKDLTALENIALPLELRGEPEAEKIAKELLAQVGLELRSGHFPRQLSGGECQRVAIARALASRPSVILADEPTGNLDPATADRISNLFFEMVERHRVALILVTHNEEMAAHCSRRYRLESGTLVSQ